MIKPFVRFISKIGTFVATETNFSTWTPIAAGQWVNLKTPDFPSLPAASKAIRRAGLQLHSIRCWQFAELCAYSTFVKTYHASNLAVLRYQIRYAKLSTSAFAILTQQKFSVLRTIWKLRVFVSFPQSWGQLRQASCVVNLSSHNSNLPLRDFGIEIRTSNATLELKLVVGASGVLPQLNVSHGLAGATCKWRGSGDSSLGLVMNTGILGKSFVCQLGLWQGVCEK